MEAKNVVNESTDWNEFKFVPLSLEVESPHETCGLETFQQFIDRHSVSLIQRRSLPDFIHIGGMRQTSHRREHLTRYMSA